MDRHPGSAGPAGAPFGDPHHQGKARNNFSYARRRTPASSLEGKTPLEMLATDVGSAKISNLALAMVHGVPI